MEKLSQVEPRAHLFIQDQLRSSPLLFFSQALDVLLRDAGHLAGIRHSVFGDTLGVGFNALNPGFARGVLITETPADHEDLRADGIYLLPEVQPVYDFEEDEFSFWVAPEIGKMLPWGAAYVKPGFGIDNSEDSDRDFTFEIGFRYFF